MSINIGLSSIDYLIVFKKLLIYLDPDPHASGLGFVLVFFDLTGRRGSRVTTPVGVRRGVSIPHGMAEVCGGCWYKNGRHTAVAH